jgi:hypothetical protein
MDTNVREKAAIGPTIDCLELPRAAQRIGAAGAAYRPSRTALRTWRPPRPLPKSTTPITSSNTAITVAAGLALKYKSSLSSSQRVAEKLILLEVSLQLSAFSLWFLADS